MKKKLIQLGLILAVGVMGIPAAHALGPRVTKVTPYAGIPKYAHMNETYQGELTAGAWGIEAADHSIVGKTVISAIIESSGKAVDKTVGLVVGPGKLKFIAAVAIQAGLLLGQGYFEDWLEQQSLQLLSTNPVSVGDPAQAETLYPNGIAVGHEAEAQVSGVWVDEGAPGMGPWYSEYAGSWKNYVRVIAPLGQGAQWCYNNGYTASSGGNNLNWSSTYWGHREKTTYNSPVGWVTNDCCYYVVHSAVDPYVHPISEMIEQGVIPPLSEEEMRARIEAAYGVPAQVPLTSQLAQGSLAAVAPSVNSANANWPAAAPNYSTGALSSSQGSTVQQALDDSISEDQTAEVTEGGERQSGDTDWEYTPEEMARAQYDMDKKLEEERKAEYDNVGVTALGDPSVPEPPEKQSITETLEDFVSGQQSGGIIALLDSAKEINSSGGTCSMSVDLGEWGAVDFSFCEWESHLSAFGNMLVMLCSLGWLLWFFMGRGDA